MIKKLTRGAIIAIAAVMLLLPFNKANAGIPIGTWRSHPAYNNAVKTVKAFGYIYVLSDGALYFYDPLDEGIYTIDKTGGLGDTDITTFGLCKSENALLIIYSNGNIDIIYSDETIYNFTDLKNSNNVNLSVNDLKFNGNIAYISTNMGLILFDVKKKEIKNTYRFDTAVNSSVLINDSLFCGTDAGIYLGLVSDNLLDNTKWKLFSNYIFTDLFLYDGELSGQSIYKSIWTFNRHNAQISLVKEVADKLLFPSNNQLALIKDTTVTLYNSYSDFKNYKFNGQINDILIDGNDWWLCQGFNGLCRYKVTDDTVICKSVGIKPNSPRRNWFHSVSWTQDGKMLIVGGCHNYNNMFYEGTLMTYKNNRWSYFEDNIQSITGVKYENLTEAVQDPNDENHHFVGSMGQGLYEFKNGKFVKLHTWNNSRLTSILNNSQYEKDNFVRISALQYDNQGNLWMANNEIDTIIKVLEPNGNWFSLYYEALRGLPTFKQLKFDKNNRIWLNSSRYKAGLVCIDTKGTIKDNSDDLIKFAGPYFTNQDGNVEEIYDIYFYEFDLNGEIWIGTNAGIFVLRHPEKFISEPKTVFERIKIPRNDGSGLADYLFSGVMTTSIYIDQGNRKWIGTIDQGVFLLSADGTQTLEHFTVNNSPLPSNHILSITENGQDGSIFFGTSLGMIEYGGQARDPKENLSKSSIQVYPNPVKPDFDDFVTITGLTQWSTIRIIGNSGRLIHQGTSNGGSYSWNLTDMNGNKVPSGVYHAIITNQENNDSESTSITVIR